MLSGFPENYETLSSISSSTFQLPAQLSSRLREVSDDVYNGLGFQVVRGIDPSEYSPRQSVILHAGLSAHICPERGYVDVHSERVVGMFILMPNAPLVKLTDCRSRRQRSKGCDRATGGSTSIQRVFVGKPANRSAMQRPRLRAALAVFPYRSLRNPVLLLQKAASRRRSSDPE